MKQAKPSKRITKQQQEQEIAEILVHFFEESSSIVRAARIAARKKYPDLFTTSVK